MRVCVAACFQNRFDFPNQFKRSLFRKQIIPVCCTVRTWCNPLWAQIPTDGRVSKDEFCSLFSAQCDILLAGLHGGGKPNLVIDFVLPFLIMA